MKAQVVVNDLPARFAYQPPIDLDPTDGGRASARHIRCDDAAVAFASLGAVVNAKRVNLPDPSRYTSGTQPVRRTAIQNQR